MKPNEAVIVSDIPFQHYRSPLVLLLLKMQPGDSIWLGVERFKGRHAGAYFGSYAKSAGVRVKTKREGAGYRIWRIE